MRIKCLPAIEPSQGSSQKRRSRHGSDAPVVVHTLVSVRIVVGLDVDGDDDRRRERVVQGVLDIMRDGVPMQFA